MNIIKQDAKIINNADGTKVDGLNIYKNIEKFARTCYNSIDKMTDDSYKEFLPKILNHTSVFEHEKLSFELITNRAIQNELVRHRVGCAYSVESTRYCNYSNGKYGSEITVIEPLFEYDSEKYNIWLQYMLDSEYTYMKLLELRATPDEARGVLPLDLKTKMIATFNITELRHVFKERLLNKKAHPQIRELTKIMLDETNKIVPLLFEDITRKYDNIG